MSSADSVSVEPKASTHAAALGTLWLRRNLRIGSRRDVKLFAWLLLALFSCFLAYVARMHEVTHDAFHEMALFRESLVLGYFPTADLFAYTPTVDPSVHHEWGTGAVLYFATVGSGLGVLGLSVLRLLLIALLWLALYRVARMRGCHPILFAMLSILTFPVLWVGFATVRAQLFTLVFIACQLWMQEQDCRGRRSWVFLWLLMLVLWLNLHAGFVVGLGLIAFHSMERFVTVGMREKSLGAAVKATWHLMAIAPIAASALLLNPYGWDYIPYLIRAIAMPRPLILEWQPLWKTYAPVITVSLFAIAVAFYIYAQRSVRSERLRGTAFLALASYMALKHIRHGSIFAVVWIAYVPAWISQARLGKKLVEAIESNRSVSIRCCQAITAVTLAFASLNHVWMPSLPPQRLYSTACYPTGAVQYLKEHQFSGNILTPFHVGAYVSWEMYPQAKVSLDGRYEVAYQEMVMPEHNQFFAAEENWWQMLDRYPTDIVLVHRQAPVCNEFHKLSSDYRADDRPATKEPWEVVYEDDSFVILASEHCNRLPSVDHREVPLQDGAWEAFSSAHAHWNRKSTHVPVSSPTELAGR